MSSKQATIIKLVSQKGGWQNMPLPPNWTQIITNNSILYISESQGVILDAHPYKLLSLGNPTQRKLVQITAAHQRKGNNPYISTWATTPFPESGWLKLYAPEKKQMIYYNYINNQITARHPCKRQVNSIKFKNASTKTTELPSSSTQSTQPMLQLTVPNMNIDHDNNSTSNKKTVADTSTNDTDEKYNDNHSQNHHEHIMDIEHPIIMDLDQFIEKDLQKSRQYGSSYAKSQNLHTDDNKKPKKKTPHTPPPRLHDASIPEILPNKATSLKTSKSSRTAKKNKDKPSRRTKSSFERNDITRGYTFDQSFLENKSKSFKLPKEEKTNKTRDTKPNQRQKQKTKSRHVRGRRSKTNSFFESLNNTKSAKSARNVPKKGKKITNTKSRNSKKLTKKSTSTKTTKKNTT